MKNKIRIRDAATIIIVRDASSSPSILMGQRGPKAAFMPSKFVFPGGAIDFTDTKVTATPLPPVCASRLSERSIVSPTAIAAAAIRELWEETGQILGNVAPWTAPPPGWRGFAATGHIPNAAALTFFFRAVTPIGASRRFDARFLLADSNDLCTDPDNFSGAEDELTHLQWVPLENTHFFDLPFITQVVVAELKQYLPNRGSPKSVPFFANEDEHNYVHHLNGGSQL